MSNMIRKIRRNKLQFHTGSRTFRRFHMKQEGVRERVWKYISNLGK